MDNTHAADFIPELRSVTAHTDAAVPRGALELTRCMHQAMKMDFAPFIEPLFLAMRVRMARTKDEDEDAGCMAPMALVQRFGDFYPDMLLPAFEMLLAATLCSTPSKEWTWHAPASREVHDLLTAEGCSRKPIRNKILCLSFVAKTDEDGGVKRMANRAWKTVGFAPAVVVALVS